MLPKDHEILKPQIGFATSAGAITIAIQKIKEEGLLENAIFKQVNNLFQEEECEPPFAEKWPFFKADFWCLPRTFLL